MRLVCCKYKDSFDIEKAFLSWEQVAKPMPKGTPRHPISQIFGSAYRAYLKSQTLPD